MLHQGWGRVLYCHSCALTFWVGPGVGHRRTCMEEPIPELSVVGEPQAQLIGQSVEHPCVLGSTALPQLPGVHLSPRFNFLVTAKLTSFRTRRASSHEVSVYTVHPITPSIKAHSSSSALVQVPTARPWELRKSWPDLGRQCVCQDLGQRQPTSPELL